MKFLVDVRPYNKHLVTAALESGADFVICEAADVSKVKKLGRIKVIAESGDLIPNKDIFFVDIKDKQDEQKAAELGQKRPIVVNPKDWKIIPLENLIAQVREVYVYINSREEIETSKGILEKGVSGVVLQPKTVAEIKEIASLVRGEMQKLSLKTIEIEDVIPLGMGDRVCIDTIENMKVGEGMLVGNASDGFFLVHSESLDNEYVNARPFRVNAGGVHCYILLPDNKTAYLSELHSGDSVLVVDRKGNTHKSYIGRIKQEKRPMLLIRGHFSHNGRGASVVLQNAETIRLINTEGMPVSVVELKKGNRVLGFDTSAGRHFGMAVQESIVEK